MAANTVAIDDYAKDGGPEVVWHLCSFLPRSFEVVTFVLSKLQS